MISKTKENKVAVVTGGVRRLGRQISYFLAKEGYSLALIYNSSPRSEIEVTKKYLYQTGTEFELYKCDIKEIKAIEKTIDKIGNRFKKIDLLINNSGIIKKVNFDKITPATFDDTMKVNVRAALFITQYALKLLNKSRNPLIINIASLGGMQNWTGYFPYSISKTALIKLTYLLARKLAPKIRVNAISPGTIIIKGEEEGTPGKISVEKIPLKKYGKPDNIIEAIKFIMTCSYLTGHVIPIDGGRLLGN